MEPAVSEPTVSRLLGRRRRPLSQTWRTFVTNHVAFLVSMDFFTVPTLTFRVLYCFFVIEHGRRRILHFNVTEHPTGLWIVQQLREAFPESCVRSKSALSLRRSQSDESWWVSVAIYF